MYVSLYLLFCIYICDSCMLLPLCNVTVLLLRVVVLVNYWFTMLDLLMELEIFIMFSGR